MIIIISLATGVTGQTLIANERKSIIDKLLRLYLLRN